MINFICISKFIFFCISIKLSWIINFIQAHIISYNCRSWSKIIAWEFFKILYWIWISNSNSWHYNIWWCRCRNNLIWLNYRWLDIRHNRYWCLWLKYSWIWNYNRLFLWNYNISFSTNNIFFYFWYNYFLFLGYDIIPFYLRLESYYSIRSFNYNCWLISCCCC